MCFALVMNWDGTIPFLPESICIKIFIRQTVSWHISCQEGIEKNDFSFNGFERKQVQCCSI